MATVVPGLPGIGYYFGTGLSQGLQSLAQQKAEQMQKKELINRFVSIGFHPEEAYFISQLPIEKQVEIISATGGIGQQQSQPSNLVNLLDQVPPTQSQLLNTQNPLGQLLGQPNQQPAAQSPEMQQVQQMREQIQSPQVQQQSPAVAPVTENKPKRSLSQLSQNPINKEQIKAQREQEKAAEKETLPYYKDLLKADKGATENDKRINRMEHLVKKEGGLPVAAFYKLFKDLSDVNPTHTAAAGGLVGHATAGPAGAALGAVVGGLVQPIATLLRYVQKQTSPNTEEYEKLTADFIRDAKNVFGARITDADLAAFMQMIPSLAVSDAGKLQIIKNMRNFNEATHIKSKVMKDIIKENNGKRPANLELLVDERAEPEIEKLAQSFTTGVETVQAEQQKQKSVPKLQQSSNKRLSPAEIYAANKR